MEEKKKKRDEDDESFSPHPKRNYLLPKPRNLPEGPTHGRERNLETPFHIEYLEWPSRCRIPEPNLAMCTSRGQLLAIGQEDYCSDPTQMASKGSSIRR